ncbi:MAG: 50S ribosomal protein L5 [Vampirovibrionales bacterium]|nr:50S ribosomal protein L5 [Vampirovibrionales bacterium]
MPKNLKEQYKEKIVPALQKELDYDNVMQVPRLEKIVINIGLGDGTSNNKIFDAGVQELTDITGQKAVVTRAKTSIAGFKIREGMPIGAKVTLRGDRMYDFLAKLIGVVLPRIRDFRGLNPRGFDGRGNYNLGLKDQLVFPEINYDRVQRLRGMNITFVTTADNDVAAKALFTHLGFPFRKPKSEQAQSNEQTQAS